MVDDQPLLTDSLGLKTVGQVISHLNQQNKLVVHLLIDGQEPDSQKLGAVKKAALSSHTVYIETAEPQRLALEALETVEAQLAEADRLRADAVQLLRTDQSPRAMEKLRGCFSTWQHAEESVTKTTQLLRIDLGKLKVDGRPFADVIEQFRAQLDSISESLESRDFVLLCDTLQYEAQGTAELWRKAIEAIRSVIS